VKVDTKLSRIRVNCFLTTNGLHPIRVADRRSRGFRVAFWTVEQPWRLFSTVISEGSAVRL